MSSYIDNKTKSFINEQNDDITNDKKDYSEKKDHHLYKDDDSKNDHKHKFIRLIKHNLDYQRITIFVFSMFISYFIPFIPKVILIYFVIQSFSIKKDLQQCVIYELNHLFNILNKIKQEKMR